MIRRLVGTVGLVAAAVLLHVANSGLDDPCVACERAEGDEVTVGVQTYRLCGRCVDLLGLGGVA